MQFKLTHVLILLTFLLSSTLFAQKMYKVEYPSQADFLLYEVEYESQCDLKVFWVEYESHATEAGLWYTVEYESQADFKYQYAEYESDADLKIYFVDYKSHAGWNNEEKKDLLKIKEE